MIKHWLIIAPLLWSAAQGQTIEHKVEVKAGKSHRKDTPVHVRVPVPHGVQRLMATASCDGRAEPAQVALAGGGVGIVWWIVRDLPAGKTKAYTVRISPGDCPKSTKVFKWKESSKGKAKSMDLLFGDRPVLRYIYTPFDERDIEGTKKPFHHVFSPDGSRLITKGAGGKYSHHRGIFFGYNRCRVDGRSYDIWHAANGEHQLHKGVDHTVTGPVWGGHGVKIHWNDREGRPFVEETRSIYAYRQSDGHLLISFWSRLKPTRGPVKLDGDRQHAGVQFRAAQAVAENEKATRYLRPAKWRSLAPDKQYNTPEHKDLPWNAIQYSLGDQEYTVAYLTDPKNPDNAAFSERLYGRFGEFFPWELRQDNPLRVHYRWWIGATRSITREQVEQRYQDLANPPEVVLKQPGKRRQGPGF